MLIARRPSFLSGTFAEFDVAAKYIGLQINERKTKYMRCHPKTRNTVALIQLAYYSLRGPKFVRIWIR